MVKRDRYLDTSKAAERLHVDVRTIQKWCKSGKIKNPSKPGKKWLIPESEVELLLKEEAAPSPKAETRVPQVETPPEVPEELIPDIEKLAQRLEQLTHVPEPETPFLPNGTRDDPRIVDAAAKGDTHALLSVFITGPRTPWWCAKGSVQPRRHLTWEQEAVLDRFIGLPTSQQLKALLDEWEEKANDYLRLKQLEANAGGIEQAYRKAHEVSQRLHSELWKAVEGLRWEQ